MSKMNRHELEQQIAARRVEHRNNLGASLHPEAAAAKGQLKLEVY